MPKPFLSKSKYLNGLQCPKLLWYYYNDKEAIPPVDAATEAVFTQGHLVGDLAKQLYGDGIDVDWDVGFQEVLQQTRELLASRRPLFEAGFLSNNTYARVDILNPVAGGKWDIIEVKSSSSVKDIYLPDVAFQKYCYEGAGVEIDRCFVAHVDTSYVRDGEIDPHRLFAVVDVTDRIEEHLADVPGKVEEMLETIALRQCPEVCIGTHCDKPYECPMKELCWEHVYENGDHVFMLPNARGRDWALYEQGIFSRYEIPENYNLTRAHRIILEAERTGKPYVEVEKVEAFLEQLQYPLHYLDFETCGYNSPIPLMDGYSPYRHLVFQYSLHVVESQGSDPVHHSWLWDGEGDPRKKFMENLLRDIGDEGSIVVYNATFEKCRLKETAEVLDEYVHRVDDLLERIVDLIVPFRSYFVYHPDQQCSNSMKSVLPALTGRGYDEMEISSGDQAGNEFVRVTFEEVDQEERQKVRAALEEYCTLDTLGMVWITARLKQLSSIQKRFEYSRKPSKCPVCNGKTIARILWGMPAFSEELEADLKSGRVILGGCCVSGDDPKWQCTACGVEIFRKKEW